MIELILLFLGLEGNNYIVLNYFFFINEKYFIFEYDVI